MAIYLNEMQAGTDRDLIGFPNLLLCQGVVLQTKAFLYGLHFDDPANTVPTAGALLHFIRSRGGDVGNGVALYGCCNWRSRYENSVDRKHSGKHEMRIIARQLGYRGVVRGFDTTIITNTSQKGRYVQFRPQYTQQNCRIYWKVQDNADFTGGTASPDKVKQDTSGNLMLYRLGADNQASPVTKGGKHAVALTTDFNAGAIKTKAGTLLGSEGLVLTELDYALRLIEFRV